MDSKLRNNWLIILTVLGLSAYCLYPPGENLVLGPDLAGGTTLLYEVDVPDGADTQETLARVIDVVQDRVDPDGVRNLTFRAVEGGRLQILMPHPSKEVIAKRDAYQSGLEAVTASNVSTGRLLAALKLGADSRDQMLASLVQGVEARGALYEEVKLRQDALTAAEAAMRGTAAEAGSDEHIALARAVFEARRALDDVMARIEATNVDAGQLARTLELDTRDKFDTARQPIPGSSARAAALEKLYTLHPERRQQIERLVVARDAYYSEKRPLDDANDLIHLLKGQGELEFRIAVEPNVDSVPDVEQMLLDLREHGPGAVSPSRTTAWFAIDDIDEWLDNNVRYAASQSDRPRAEVFAEHKRDLESNPTAYLLRDGFIGGSDGREYYILLWNTPDRSLTHRATQPGWQLTEAFRDMDRKGMPGVGFRLNTQGASLFGTLTKTNVGRRMAIVLDGRVNSAPNINSPIDTGSGIIEGRFNDTDLNYLINTLSAGSLQARLHQEPIEIRTIQPSLGKDNLDQGLKAAWLSLAAVGSFVILYYFFGGIVANLAMIANLVIILGVMSQLRATFTLAGIAGIILNIGMCVDANVLIFERIREELRRGADMATALRLGHDRAFSAILDGNLTTLIVCIVLGYYGTADIKGFGVTLGIGLMANLFTAVFMAHVILKTVVKAFPRWRMGMLPLVFPSIDRHLRPNIDWVGKRGWFYSLSILACVASIALCVARGADLFDIEFRSGTEVSFKLTEGTVMSHGDVADALAGTELKEATVVVVGETDALNRASEFSIITEKTDTAQVAATIRASLGDKLDIRPVLSFKGSDAQDPSSAPMFPVTKGDLGESIGRAAPRDVSDYRGGVVILLDGVTPSASVESVRDRIKSMRLQPEYEKVSYRAFDVFGLEPDPARPDRFTTLAVVCRDPAADYFTDEGVWRSGLAEPEWQLVRDAMTREQSFSKVSRFTPQVANTMVANALVSLTLSLAGILAYMWFRFGSLRFGVSGIVALGHDVIIALGVVAASSYIYQWMGPNPLLIIPFKINMGMIAALLTIVGYSINDKIVVFDRIRENRGKLAVASAGVVNDSINQTLSRTFLTGGGVLMSVLLLYAIGGEAVRGFALTMFAGIVAGTYSSIAIASPLLLFGQKGSDAKPDNTAPKV